MRILTYQHAKQVMPIILIPIINIIVTSLLKTQKIVLLKIVICFFEEGKNILHWNQTSVTRCLVRGCSSGAVGLFLVCVCGRLLPNTSQGRAKHLDSCSLCREVAGVVRRERDGNEFALTGAVAGLITQSLSVSVHGGSVGLRIRCSRPGTVDKPPTPKRMSASTCRASTAKPPRP
jgi:hypothetical protein